MAETPPGLAALPDAPRHDRVEVGQLWLARPDRGTDLLVLVVGVYTDQVEALVCGTDWQLATDTDSVLEPAATGYLRRLLVHGDACGRIPNRRLAGPVGRVAPELAERIALRGRGLDFGSTDLGRGRAVLEETDPRWEHKLEQFRRLRGVRARAGEVGFSVHRFGGG